MFIGAEKRLDVGFHAAQARLGYLARGGLLRRLDLAPGDRREPGHSPRAGPLVRLAAGQRPCHAALVAADRGRMGDSMTEATARQRKVLAGYAGFLVTAAARAPSVHNTQPWRFRVGPDAVELRTDPRRKLRADPAGREMLISCGAALFGLRLAIRSLGYLPVTELLPDPAQLRLAARVRIGDAAPAHGLERQMLDAVPHRHTHRGPFAPGPLPSGLLAGLQHDALAEGATLALVTGGLACDRLERITTAAARRGNLSPRARADIRRWTGTAAGMARDGIPATALAASAGRPPGLLPQRDFDLGRGITCLPSGGAPPSATAVLLTPGDRRADWLRAGQALYRLLLHAAGQRVFASLHTQPLEDAVTRDLISSQLALPGHPQMLLQLGPATTASVTARRPPGEPDGP